MTGTLGTFALVCALILACVQVFVPLYGMKRANPYALAVLRPSAWAQFAFVLCAYLTLMMAFISNDFTLSYVVQNSHANLPWIYRLTAVWGGHEGSILLWVLMLNAWTVAFVACTKQREEYQLPTIILGMISAGFLAFLIFTSNPFVTIAAQEGHDLNPLLQDPGFVIHPPILYAGYVGFVVALALTLSALWRRELTTAWAYRTRQWALAAWSFLTLGITLGSWWAYRVLGWGGFWFWDPVENASLLPWLSGVALIHMLLVVEKKDSGYRWAVLLAILTFSLSLLGTFLVRSGVLVSAHTFANDPARGAFLLALLALIGGGSLVLYAYRIYTPRTQLSFQWFSRETLLWLNSVLFMAAMTTILLGTIYPLLIDAFGLGAISVGAPYFNLVVMPILFLMLMLMGWVPFLSWQGLRSAKVLRLAWVHMALSLLLALIIAYTMHHFTFSMICGLSLCFWVILSVRHLVRDISTLGVLLAHLGFAAMIIGVLFSSAFSQDREVRLRKGESVALGPYVFQFVGTNGVEGSNYRGIQGKFSVIKQGYVVTTLEPEKRIYTVRDMVMSKVAIHPGIFRDLYIALGEPYSEDEWSVRIYYKPFIRWVWLGGILMMLGGLLALLRPRELKT